MRSFIVIAMFAVGLAQAGWSDYEEVRNMDLDVDGISQLSIKAGAGSMGFGGDAHIVLEVSVPQGLAVHIDDGSGSIDVDNASGDVSIRKPDRP